MSVTVILEAHAKGEAPDVKPEEKQPVIVHCRDCGHEWAAFYFPLVMDAKGMRLMKTPRRHARCARATGFTWAPMARAIP